MDRTEREYLMRCKRMIEEKFHFGNGNGELRQRDFEYLADMIEEKSGIMLSLSTLKRLWKNDYDKTPHPSTLQALVSVLEYRDWNHFRGTNGHEEERMDTNVDKQQVVEEIGVKRRFAVRPWVLLPVVIAVAVLFWLIAFRSGPGNRKPVVKGEVKLTGNKTVSQGVPNTVIFNYDVSTVDADSFFLQQSWNPAEKTKLDPKNDVYTAIYYYPGFHRAKLIANDSIIKKFRVHITTDGWFPLANYDQGNAHPIYIKKKDAAGDSVLHVSREDLAASEVNVEKDFSLSYYNVRDFDAHSDNFTLETRIKSDQLKTIACPGFQLTIMTEEHIYVVDLVGKGCERDVTIKMGEVIHRGVNKDLSVFGRDMHQWQNLKIKVAGKKATIYLDDQPVYSLNYKNDFGKIVGLLYGFIGTGAVDYVRLTNGDGKLVYGDEFN